MAWAQESCGLAETEEVAAAAPRWVDVGSGLALVADLPAGTWDVRVEARLGGLRHAWTFELTAVEATSTVDLRIPEEAWLDDLAASYVTNLVVRLTGTSPETGGLVLLAPRAYLAWPGGSGSTPVVWDAEAQEREAPLGVLDAAIREAALADGVVPTRILPPLALAPAPRDVEE